MAEPPELGEVVSIRAWLRPADGWGLHEEEGVLGSARHGSSLFIWSLPCTAVFLAQRGLCLCCGRMEMNLHNWKVTCGSINRGFPSEGTCVGLGMICPSWWSLDGVVGFVLFGFTFYSFNFKFCFAET